MSKIDLVDKLGLVTIPVSQIIVFWRPGLHEWSWREQYADVLTHTQTPAIVYRVKSEGIGFIDHIAPVLLGNDGRVWDGHHRICIAIRQGIPTLKVELAGIINPLSINDRMDS